MMALPFGTHLKGEPENIIIKIKKYLTHNVSVMIENDRQTECLFIPF